MIPIQPDNISRRLLVIAEELDYAMNASVGQTFQVAQFTGVLDSVSASGAMIEFALVSSSGFTRTIVGNMAVLLTHGASRHVQMQLAIPLRYHELEFLRGLRSAVFSALDISENETWCLTVSPAADMQIESRPSEGWIELVSSG